MWLDKSMPCAVCSLYTCSTYLAEFKDGFCWIPWVKSPEFQDNLQMTVGLTILIAMCLVGLVDILPSVKMLMFDPFDNSSVDWNIRKAV